MKKKQIFWILLSLIGLLIVFYPNIADAWNRRRDAKLRSEYEYATQQIDDTEKEEILKAAAEYNQSLVGSVVPAVFLEKEYEADPLYDSLLSLTADGMMGEVEIPCIRVRIPIYHYAIEESLNKGAGHLLGSSLPVGGESTHAVISAHRGLPNQKLFTDLDRVKEGDLFYIRVLGETLAYEVDDIKVVEPTEAEGLAISKGEDYVTLLTCTPYAVNTHRLLVRGRRVPYSEEQYEAESKKITVPHMTSVLIRILCVIAGILLAAGTVIVFRLIEKRRKKNGKKKNQEKDHP